MFGITAIPSLLFFVGHVFRAGKPALAGQKWQAGTRARRSGKNRRRKLRGAAMTEIEATLANEIQNVNFRDLLDAENGKVLLLGVGLAMFQQWCGINTIFNYAEEIFKAAGYDISTVLKNIAWTGSVNLAFTFVALGVVDRVGRRPLMLFGAAGLAVIYLRAGFLLPRVRDRPADAAARAVGHRLLFHVARAGHLGGHFGNFPEPHPWRGDGGRRGGAVARVFLLTYTFPDFERQTRTGGNLLALRRHLCAWLCFHFLQTAGNQKQIPGTNRTRTCGLTYL